MNNKEYIVTVQEIFDEIVSVYFLGSFTSRKDAVDRVERDIESQIDFYKDLGYEFNDKEKTQIRKENRIIASDWDPVRVTEWTITESDQDPKTDVCKNIFEFMF